MQAIETRYNGHRFRSRTEARWAVLLDHLGVKYEYEPEGYDFGNGTRYLPDFYLPKEDCFLEIKGKEPTLGEIHKAGMLAFHSGKYVDLLVGAPGDYEMVAIRGKRRLSEDVASFLRTAPNEQMSDWLLSVVVGDTGLYAPTAIGEQPAMDWHFLKSPSRPYYVHGIKHHGWKDEHFELDYDAEFGTLAIWRAAILLGHGNEAVDERYSLYEVVDDHVQTLCSRQPIAPNGWEKWENADAVTVSREWTEAVDAAKSARFEFGESGAG